MSDDLLLTLLWLLPLAGALFVLFLPGRAETSIKGVSLAVTLVTFVLTLGGLRDLRRPDNGRVGAALSDRAAHNVLKPPATSAGPSADGEPRGDPGRRGRQGRPMTSCRRAWIPYFNIQYYLGLDGISLSLVLLTGLVSVLACLASWSIEKQVKGYFSLFLLLMASMMGVFVALDLFLFYVFFEVMLLPMYFLIGVWGGENREYAAIKFLLYTLFGSVFILVAVLVLYFWPGDAVGRPGSTAHTFDIVELTRVASTDGVLRHAHPELDLRSVLDRLLRQAAVVPVPHLAPRRPRPGADADQHDPGGRPAEDRRLRPDPPGLAAGAAGRVRRRRSRWPCWASSASSTAPWWRWRRPTSRSWSLIARSATWATSRWAWR